MSELKELTVFDAGPNNHFSLSNIAFINGLAITDKESDKTLLRNYIEQTGSNWTETVFDPANLRHSSASLPANMQHIVTGIQTSAKVGNDDNQLAKAIIDGTYVDLASTLEGKQVIDPASLVTSTALAKALKSK